MKYKIVPTSKFKKDLKTMIKRGYDTKLLDDVVTVLDELDWRKYYGKYGM